MSDTEQATRVHPLWKNFVSTMKDAGRLHYGAFFTTTEMESALSCKEESVEFAFAVARVRRALRRDGKNFTARGQRGQGFQVAAVETNHAEMQRLQQAAMNAMREGVILGTHTPIELLSSEDRRKHEAVLEKMAVRLALINRRSPEARIQ